MGAPTWPPCPQRSGRPGEPVAPRGQTRARSGAPTWPPYPQRSGRPGEPVAPRGRRLALGAPFEVRLAGGAGLVEAAHRRRDRRRGRGGGAPPPLPRDLDPPAPALVQRPLPLGLPPV